MAFVLDKEGNYLPVFGIAKSIVDSSYLPNETTINVKLDGSGDFTTFKDALDYLTGKISDGTVKVVLGSGTFDVNGNLPFYISKVNIPRIEISGQGKDNTIINGKNTPDWNGVINIGNNNSIVCFKDLTINTENSTTGCCLKVNGGNVQIYGTTAFTNGNTGVVIFGNGSVYIADCNMYLTNNASAGIICQGGGNVIIVSTKFYLDTVGTAFSINIGTIKMWNCTKSSATSVTNLFSQTANTLTSQGYILSDLT